MADDFDISQFLEEDDDEAAIQEIPVTSPSGSTFMVLNEAEAIFYEQMTTRYLDDNKLKNVSDFLELDRILVMELMCHRWALWMLSGQDYEGRKVNLSEVQKSINVYSREIREIKKDLGIDKSTRDRDRGEDFAQYVDKLALRAQAFGVMRNEQAVKAVTLWKELQGIVTLHLNSNAVERSEFNVHEADIVTWIAGKFDEFDAIDDAFRQEQKLWIREINK